MSLSPQLSFRFALLTSGIYDHLAYIALLNYLTLPYCGAYIVCIGSISLGQASFAPPGLCTYKFYLTKSWFLKRSAMAMTFFQTNRDNLDIF